MDNQTSQSLTSSRQGTFYFAYGSNLSHAQMRIRCYHESSSSVPLAITRLDGWKWIICERGYANIVELPAGSEEAATTAVYGVVYNLAPNDEKVLDGWEGYDDAATAPSSDESAQHRRPRLQGECSYNKIYLPVTVTKWLMDDPGQFRVPSLPPKLTVLAYVDELRTDEGTVYRNYIGRMNRGIDESVALGLPGDWVEKTMRKWVTPGIYPPPEYVGMVPKVGGGETDC